MADYAAHPMLPFALHLLLLRVHYPHNILESDPLICISPVVSDAEASNIRRKELMVCYIFFSVFSPYRMQARARPGSAPGATPPAPGRGRGRTREKREQLQTFRGLLPESQGQHLALTVLCVPYSLCLVCAIFTTAATGASRWGIWGWELGQGCKYQFNEPLLPFSGQCWTW